MSVEIDAEQLKLLTSGLPARYKIDSVLGRGGMGIVLSAQDLQLSRSVAIKLLQIEATPDPNLQERFAREARALASLNHPNIVKLLTWGITETGTPYHVLEFVEGEPLSQIMERQGKLSPRQFQQVFQQVIAGLKHAHEHNIVHRDLKPGNIIITSSNGEGLTAKIIDFGVARILEANAEEKITRTLSLVGSPAYMSPEQCKGMTPDRRADYYSLACIMYEALSGKLPFEADNSIDLMYKHTNAEWISLESLMLQSEFKDLAKLIDRCLAKNPDDRPQEIGEIEEVFSRTFSRQTSSNKLFLLLGQNEEKTGTETKRCLAITAVVLLLVLGIAGTLALIQRNDRIRQEELAVQTQPEKKEVREIETREQEVNSLKKQLRALERELELENDTSRKKELVNSITNKSRKLGKTLADLSKHQDAALAYSRLLKYCKYQDEPGIARADTYRLMAREYSSNGEYKRALELCEKGIEQLKQSANADGDTVAFLYLLKAENEIYLKDFNAALEDFKKVEVIWSGLTYLDPGSPLSIGAERDRLNVIVGLFKITNSQSKNMTEPVKLESARKLAAELSDFYSTRRSREQSFLKLGGIPKGFMKNTPQMRDTFFRATLINDPKLPERLESDLSSKSKIKNAPAASAK